MSLHPVAPPVRIVLYLRLASLNQVISRTEPGQASQRSAELAPNGEYSSMGQLLARRIGFKVVGGKRNQREDEYRVVCRSALTAASQPAWVMHQPATQSFQRLISDYPIAIVLAVRTSFSRLTVTVTP